MIKLAASNFAGRFIGVQGKESPILGNFALAEAQNRTNRLGRIARVARAKAARWAAMVRATRRIGMCGYTALPEDGRAC